MGLSDLSIAKKLNISFLALIIIMALGVLNVFLLQNIKQNYFKILDFDFERIMTLGEMESSFLKQQDSARDYIITKSLNDKQNYITTGKNFDEQFKKYKDFVIDPLKLEKLEEIQKQHSQMETLAANIFLRYEKEDVTGQEIKNMLNFEIGEIEDLMDELKVKEEMELAWAENQFRAGINIINAVIAASAVIALCLGIFLVVYMARWILGPIKKLTKGTEIIGKGDLSYRIKAESRDEIGKLAKDFNLMTANLKISQDKLKEMNQAKSEFVSIASHQLLTPLGIIRGYISMILEGSYGKLDQSKNIVLNRIYQSSGSLIKLVEDLLDVSKIELGQTEGNPKLIQLEDIVEEKVKESGPLAKRHDCRILFSKQKLPKVKTDPLKIKQVIQNLIDNGIRYSRKPGEVKVKLGLSKDKRHLMFAIQDNGIGIPKDQQDRIFAKFFRADNAKEIKKRGTGLGLFIAKSIIEQGGGKIWFESKENKGSTFYFSLPVAKQ